MKEEEKGNKESKTSTGLQKALKMFISYELHMLVELNSHWSFYADYEADFSKINSTISCLKESSSSLEFEVNQEVFFGNDPSEDFSYLLDFCVSRFIDSFKSDFIFFMQSNHASFNVDFIKLMRDANNVKVNLTSEIFKAAKEVTYEDYFKFMPYAKPT